MMMMMMMQTFVANIRETRLCEAENFELQIYLHY